MGRHLDLGHLSEEECERILQVIQRDFDLRQKEKGRLGKIDEDMKEEDTKVAILGKQKQFNENCCMRCFSRFIFIFNQKVQCHNCQYFICKNCSTYDSKEKQYVCNVCMTQRELQTQSCDWFYTNIKKKFKRFGSAKVVRSLYKRKTDSDSENDSGYDPSHYSNSLPAGRRSRQTIEGFFAGLDKPLPSTDSCAVAESQQTFEAAKEEEAQRFRKDLNDIINDFHRTLENQTPEGLPNGDTCGSYERLLEAERSQIKNTVSNLKQSLLLALESQPGTAGDPASVEERRQVVQDVVVKEVGSYVGRPIILGEERLQNGSTSDHQGPYEEVLLDAIIEKILADHKKIDDQRHLHEEQKVRKDLTKLSNQCTITQLTDLLSTDTETDDAHNSTFYTDTDTESVRSSNIQLTDTPREDMTALRRQSDAESEGSGSDLDELVAINSESAEEYRRDKQSTSSSNADNTAVRMSVSSVESSDMTIMVTSPTGETFTAVTDGKGNDNITTEINTENDLNKENGNAEEVAVIVPELQSLAQNIGERVTSGSESDATLDAEEGMLLLNDSPPDEESLRFAMDRRIPLPSFDDADSIGIKEVDLDDISRQSDGEDDDVSINVTTLDSEISFGNSWNVSQPGPLFKDRISAYDNFGQRKVGKDDNGPVFMLVPDGDVPSPRVGEKDLDELSDLSENSSKSDLSSYDSDDQSDDTSGEEDQPDNVVGERRERRKKESARRETADFAGQTDDLYFNQVGDSSEADVQQEYITMTSSSLRHDGNDTSLREQRLQQKLAEEEEKEDDEAEDPEDLDPRFVVRPKTISCPVGEVARFTCQVEGTNPLDVFWYKEGAEVEQLEDGEQYDVRCHSNRHTLDIFNTSEKDRGQYFCIAINELGQNHKTFRLRLTDNTSDKAAPEFLKPVQDVQTMCGMTVSFRCKLRGYPQPRVLWYRDGKPLRNSDQIRIQKQGNRDYLLSIEYVTMDDDAEYTVVARNIAGEARCSAQLLVEEQTDETSRKYAELEAAFSFSSMSGSKASYPGTEELLRIAEQVRSTRTGVTNTAEIVPRSSNKLSSIHGQIDEMDAKLNNLEYEVHDSMLSQESFFTEEDGGDSANNNNSSSSSATYRLAANTYQPANNSLREAILREHDDMRTSARSLRRVTSTALEVLTSTHTLLQSDAISAATTTPEQSPVRDVTTFSIPIPDPEEEVEDLRLAYADFELLYQNGRITKEQLKSGRVSRKEGQRLLADLAELKQHSVEEAMERSHNLTGETLTTSIDCGLKRVPSKRYKRDYIVNRSPQVTRKTWNVYTPSPLGTEIVRPPPGGAQELVNDAEESEYNLVAIDIDEGDYSQQEEEMPPSWIQDANSAEDEVYMSAGQVFSLEDRIKQLEGSLEQEELSDHQLAELEDQVARTVGQVKNSDTQQQEVAKVEDQVRQLGRAFHTEEPHSQSKSLDSSMGQSAREQSFMTDSESSMTMDQLELPSVKNLRSMFNEEEGASVKRGGQPYPVHSLTGRDLPRGVREKLRDQGPDVVHSSNVRLHEDTRKRPQIRMLLEDSAVHETSVEDDVASKADDFHPRSSTPFGTPKVNVSLEHSRVSTGSTPSPNSRMDHSMGRTHQPMKRTAPSPPIGTSPPITKSVSFSETSSQSAPSLSPNRSEPTDSSRGAAASDLTTSPVKTGRNSAIMARAAFWDDRILQGKASNKDMEDGGYPQLPENSFKSSVAEFNTMF